MVLLKLRVLLEACIFLRLMAEKGNIGSVYFIDGTSQIFLRSSDLTSQIEIYRRGISREAKMSWTVVWVIFIGLVMAAVGPYLVYKYKIRVALLVILVMIPACFTRLVMCKSWISLKRYVLRVDNISN
ncbi:hypothetical protein MKX03_019225, partial [Papaver bracteatum]